MISVPAKGQTTETLNMDATVTLSKNTLISNWGETLPAAVSFRRSYSQESMGRDLTAGDFGKIKEIVGGFGNTKIGTITSLGSGIASAGSAMVTILELTGVIESEKVKLDKIIGMLEDVSAQLDFIKNMLKAEEIRDLTKQMDDFKDALSDLGSYIDIIRRKFTHVEKNVLKITQPSSEFPLENAPKEEWVKYNAEWEAYFKQVVPVVIKQLGGMPTVATELNNRYDSVVKMFRHRSSYYNNTPVNVYDTYMKYIHNFDTAAYDEREDFRILTQFELVKATNVTGILYAYAEETPDNYSYQGIVKKYKEVETYMNNHAVDRRTDGKITCTTWGMTFWAEMAASNRMTDKNNRHCAIAHPTIHCFEDTAGQGSVTYMPRRDDGKVVVDGKPVDLSTNTGAVTGKEITVTKKNGSTIKWFFKGLVNYHDGSGIDLSREQAEKYIEKALLRGGDKDGFFEADLDLAGFIYPAKLTFKPVRKGETPHSCGIAYKAWSKKGIDYRSYYANCINKRQIVIADPDTRWSWIGHRGQNESSYVLNFVAEY